jgi:predicted transposase YdaD
MWAEFLSTGLAPQGAPEYLDEAAGLVKYWNSDPKEQAMRTRLRRAEELEYLVSHYERRVGREEGEAEGIIKGKAEGRIEGEAEGMIKGEAKGKMEGKAEVASRLLGMGMSVEQIATVTDLTPEQIHCQTPLTKAIV